MLHYTWMGVTAQVHLNMLSSLSCVALCSTGVVWRRLPGITVKVVLCSPRSFSGSKDRIREPMHS